MKDIKKQFSGKKQQMGNIYLLPYLSNRLTNNEGAANKNNHEI